MEEEKRGRYLPLSLQRRLICDLLHFARKVPSIPVQRRMQLADVVRARQLAPTRPSWVALFAKAFGLLSVENPRLRQAYLNFPTARLYEHPHSVASIALGREYQGEPAIFFFQMRAPEVQDLAELNLHIDRHKTCPLEEVHAFREALRFTRLPKPLRRLLWWYGLNFSGPHRARRFGTFGISTYSSLGVESLHPISPLTTVLNYGPIGDDGKVDVRLVYDHRVLDGADVGRGLRRLEEIMIDVIVKELRGGTSNSAAA